jgi:hypothetical protein
MDVQATYVSRVSVAITQEMAILCAAGPGGPIADGAIQPVETGRLVMTHRTLRELAVLLALHVAELDARDKVLDAERRTIAEEPEVAGSLLQ